MTTAYPRLRFRLAKEVLCKFHQEETLGFRVEDICQTLALIIHQLADDSMLHQIDILL